MTGEAAEARLDGEAVEEIVEVFVHLAPYIGVPKALAGLRIAAAALAGEGR
ncbi:carboxymuconolactone decarboxylase family protein [Actinoallomurus purpureus]|uniref:carboxymuconolactone decarboxylase family protein n=1 Tax=Actinoallomurus purpureus TaxID=478114 RepID=UPI002092C564|nr:carboxymuconolactone decarboxylase family protein [Actinoallomurus purpureus]MCO6007212.1 carboxymuconolactone decarboxylase family protein [Actinoallomurus purpureus]